MIFFCLSQKPSGKINHEFAKVSDFKIFGIKLCPVLETGFLGGYSVSKESVGG